MKTIELPFVGTLKKRLQEKDPLIQVVLGPRQVGKTTGVHQLISQRNGPFVYASADDVLSTHRDWILEHWQEAKSLRGSGLLVIDEIQKIPQWSETIKKLWDQQSQSGQSKIKLVLLGSGSLSLQKGLTESLAGRYELIKVHHWSFVESNQATTMSLDQYLAMGGYPGSYRWLGEEKRWHAYVKNSVVEPVIHRDILQFRQVKSPSLFKQAFEILCNYPAQEISYRKLLGQLQDKGNTDLIKSYIELYEGAFLFRAIPKYMSQAFKVKSSSPKILPLCPCLYSLFSPQLSKEKRGFVFEATVGAALNRLETPLFYWKEGKHEVDFVISWEGQIFGIEVKSGRKKSGQGLTVFKETFEGAIPVMITPENYETFVSDTSGFLNRMTK